MWLPLPRVGTSSDGFGERETAPLPRHLRGYAFQALPHTILSSPVSLGGVAAPLVGAGGCDAVWVAVEWKE